MGEREQHRGSRNSHETVDYTFAGNLELKVFALTEKAETVVYQAEKEVLSASFVKEENKITGTLTAGAKVRFVNCILKSVQGASMEVDGNDTVVTIKDTETTFVCEV